MYKFPTYSAPMLTVNPDNPSELVVRHVAHPRNPYACKDLTILMSDTIARMDNMMSACAST